MPISIALCVITYRRPVGLRNLLLGISALDVEGIEAAVSLVVIDNDVNKSACAVVEALAPRLPFPLAFATEPRRGIPFARNCALRVAGDVDVIGWLDDDEVPEPPWLARLVHAQQTSGADVVIGPCLPRFPPGTPEWMRCGGFFERTRFASGEKIPAHYARTSGVLVRRAAMPDRDAVFAEELRFCGGSDRALFVEMEQCGASFMWVDDAEVTEHIPPSRTRLRWILRRGFRIGNSRSTTLILDGATIHRRAKRMAAGAVDIVAGAAHALRGLPGGRATVVRGLWRSCYGAGLLAGAFGYRYQEYLHHHGS